MRASDEQVSVDVGHAPRTLDDLIAFTEHGLRSLVTEVCGDRPVVHLGLCNHTNVGDVALNVAEAKLLGRAGVRPVLSRTSDRPNPAPTRVPPDAAFVVHAGGNIGDLYPGELALRVQALRDHPRSPMLQMPQSIYFRDLKHADGYRAAVAAADQYVLVARERASYDWATRHLDCRVELLPDLALTLGRLTNPTTPTYDVIGLLRSDAESQGVRPLLPDDLHVVDWPAEGRSRSSSTLWARWLLWRIDRHDLPVPEQLRTALRARLDAARLERGLATLGQGKIVVTDRLHAHILSTLLGKPHLVADNSYGKISRFMQTWQMSRLATVESIQGEVTYDQAFARLLLRMS